MERFGLTFALDRQLGEYSKGMKQKLALVRAMLHDPPVLLLDEPTSAMDPQSAKLVRDAIEELQRDERTFLITTHNLTEAQQLADRIAIIRRGRIIANGNFDELARRFVGDPRMELRVRGMLNGLAHDLSDMVAVEDSGGRLAALPGRRPRPDQPGADPARDRAGRRDRHAGARLADVGGNLLAGRERRRTARRRRR